jgi:hypothetical protein
MSTTISTRPARYASSASLQVPIRTYQTLVEAERAVELLAECRFPLEYVALAARGVKRCRHRAASRALPAVATLLGGVAGAALAVLARSVGALATQAPVVALVFGAAVGAVVACAASVTLRPKRSSCYCSHAISSDCYDVLIDAEWAGDAAHVLAVADCGRPREGLDKAWASERSKP